MADYARNGDQARGQRSLQEQVRRLRTHRPVRGHVTTLTWAMEGAITLDRYFLPAMVTIDPVSDGDYPEFKQIIAVDGYSNAGGDVDISWQVNLEYFLLDHIIVGGSGTNRVTLPEPYVIDPAAFGVYGGQFIRPEIQAEPEFPSVNLSLMCILETVPE